jgi:hypothetical protein
MAKMVLPEKLTCIAIDTQARRVYLWEVWIPPLVFA